MHAKFVNSRNVLSDFFKQIWEDVFQFFFFILEIKSSYLYLNPKGEIEASILSGWLSSGEQIVFGAVSVEMPENRQKM